MATFEEVTINRKLSVGCTCNLLYIQYKVLPLQGCTGPPGEHSNLFPGNSDVKFQGKIKIEIMGYYNLHYFRFRYSGKSTSTD